MKQHYLSAGAHIEQCSKSLVGLCERIQVALRPAMGLITAAQVHSCAWAQPPATYQQCPQGQIFPTGLNCYVLSLDKLEVKSFPKVTTIEYKIRYLPLVFAI